MKRTTNACTTSEYSAGDEVLFQFEWLASAVIESVKFDGRRVRYVVKVALECEVPERLVVSHEGREGEK
jgi:hypothetical protein